MRLEGKVALITGGAHVVDQRLDRRYHKRQSRADQAGDLKDKNE